MHISAQAAPNFDGLIYYRLFFPFSAILLLICGYELL
jgi:hypothetical protein